MRQELFIALAKAYRSADHPRARTLILQGATAIRDPRIRAELQRLANSQMQLPSAVQGLCRELPEVAPDSMVISNVLRAALDGVVCEHTAVMQLRLRGLEPRRRLLFHGPPGNGKTMSAAMLCQQIGIPSYQVSVISLVASYMGVTGKNIEKVLGALDSGCGLVIDELDTIGQVRGGAAGTTEREQNAVVNALLTCLDRPQGSGLLIATTNRLDVIDPALRRRFDLELEFPPPSRCEALVLWDRLCIKYGLARGPMTSATSFDAVAKAAMERARLDVMKGTT